MSSSSAVVGAYEDYLDIYTTQIYLQVCLALWDLDAQYSQTFDSGISSLPLFNAYMQDSSYQFDDIADLEQCLAANEAALKTCELELLSQGYPRIH